MTRAPARRLEYLTDVEGDGEKLADFCAKSAFLSLASDGGLALAEGATFVFGGDAIDQAPHGIRVVESLVALKRRHGERVILIAGNRDLNKIRLGTELDSDDPEKLKWILERTMGAARAFACKKLELGPGASDRDVTRDFRAEIGPGGRLRELLRSAQLAFLDGETLVVHGGVTDENFLRLPDGAAAGSVGEWVAGLNAWYRDRIDELDRTGDSPALVAYQGKAPGRDDNPWSVVYGHYSDESRNPVLPSRAVRERLRDAGVRWVLSGHRPYGESPAVLSSREEVRFVIADNSHMPTSRASLVAVEAGALHVLSQTHVEGTGPERDVSFSLRPSDGSPIGLRDAGGFLVRALLADGRYLLARVRPDFSRSELLVSAGDLSRMALAEPEREQ